MADQELNVAQEATGGEVDLQAHGLRTDPYSLNWALKVVRPISMFVLSLLAVVMLLPFLELVLLAPTGVKIESLPAGTTPEQAQAAITAAAQGALAQRSKDLLDWAKTILPSVVGFGSAMIGYYFGTRSTEGGSRPHGPDGAKSP